MTTRDERRAELGQRRRAAGRASSAAAARRSRSAARWRWPRPARPRSAARAIARVAQDHDRHVRDRVDHQALDRHLNQHDPPPDRRRRRPPRRAGCSARLASSCTGRSCADPRLGAREIDDRVAARAAGELPAAASRRPVDQDLDGPADGLPMPLCLNVALAAPAAPRSAPSSPPPATSSAIRLIASVFGRGEYLNEYIEWNRTRRTRSSVSSKSSARLAREADDHVRRQRDAGHGRSRAVDQVEILLARVPPPHRVEARDPSRTAPAGAGACRPPAGRASRRSAARSRGADAGSRTASARARRSRLTRSSSPAKSHVGVVGRLIVIHDLPEQLDLAVPAVGGLRGTSARMSATGRMRSWPRVYGTTQNAQNSLQPSMIVTHARTGSECRTTPSGNETSSCGLTSSCGRRDSSARRRARAAASGSACRRRRRWAMLRRKSACPSCCATQPVTAMTGAIARPAVASRISPRRV